jgi:predicted nuclease of predicted toxin-antitoxin system
MARTLRRPDARAAPANARLLESDFGITAKPIRELGLHDSEDPTIFAAARTANAVVMTKDYDFV